LNMRQSRWLELVKDYDCVINYYLGKANVVVDALELEIIPRGKLGYLANMTLKLTLLESIKT